VRPCLKLRQVDPFINADYYYYATAGGAKIWVCSSILDHEHQSYMRYPVEEISDNDADHSVCHRHRSHILRKYVRAYRLLVMAHSLPAYSHGVAKYWPHLPHLGSCAGQENAAIFGCVLLTSYLGLFINFYFQTYKKPVGKPTEKVNSNGVAFVPRSTTYWIF